MPAANLYGGRPTAASFKDPDDLLFAEALPLHGESSCHHGYQENSPSAWTDSRGEGQPDHLWVGAFALTSWRISRTEGLALLAAYAGYLAIKFV